MCVKEFGVEFIYEKTFRDRVSGFVKNEWCTYKINEYADLNWFEKFKE